MSKEQNVADGAQIIASQQRAMESIIAENKRYEEALKEIVHGCAPDTFAGMIAREALYL